MRYSVKNITKNYDVYYYDDINSAFKCKVGLEKEWGKLYNYEVIILDNKDKK